jgi:hypothetical protein
MRRTTSPPRCPIQADEQVWTDRMVRLAPPRGSLIPVMCRRLSPTTADATPSSPLPKSLLPHVSYASDPGPALHMLVPITSADH